MNEYEKLRRKAERLREQYPKGTRVLLISMGDDPRPIESETRGTVDFVDDMATVFCSFDNGRSLGLIDSEDYFRKLTKQELSEEQQTMDGSGAPKMRM